MPGLVRRHDSAVRRVQAPADEWFWYRHHRLGRRAGQNKRGSNGEAECDDAVTRTDWETPIVTTDGVTLPGRHLPAQITTADTR
jgi:hypothetical protein